jgi:hypothetical protein
LYTAKSDKDKAQRVHVKKTSSKVEVKSDVVKILSKEPTLVQTVPTGWALAIEGNEHALESVKVALSVKSASDSNKTEETKDSRKSSSQSEGENVTT